MKYTILKKHFGYESFRKGQEELIDTIEKGQDVLGIMPTGGGKSICFQIPAMMRQGLTIVVSPLIALMKDQVDGLNEVGIPAAFINSSLSGQEIRSTYSKLRKGEFTLLYVAPERLLADGFMDFASQLDIGLIAVDEAHCISQWGHDFRPSYGNIPIFISNLPNRPVIAAFTATATIRVVEEIKALLGLVEPFELITGFDRPNLIYSVVKPANKDQYTKTFISQHQGDSGIVYCSTRKTVDALSGKLVKAGFKALAYHGGMDMAKRNKVQEAFMFDEVDIIVATNAFGMGIDKPDVRYVLHYNMPKNMESYYQEAGRAGRDGLESECLILYSPADIVKQKMLINLNSQDPSRVKIQYENLQYLVNYCHADSCLRLEISRYFGEDNDMDNCGSCGNCLEDPEFMDMTKEAQIIMSLIYKSGQRYGLNLIIQTLRGSKNQKVLGFRLDNQSTYGMLKDFSEGALREIIMNLIARGYLHMTTDSFPVLKLTSLSKPVLTGQEALKMKKERMTIKSNNSKSKRAKKKSPSNLDYDEKLYDILAGKRMELAKEKGKPAFVIFANATLEEIAFYKPLNKEAFMDIKGVGDNKYKHYGKIFIDLVTEYMNK